MRKVDMDIFWICYPSVLTCVSYLKRSGPVGKSLHLRAVGIASKLWMISCFECWQICRVKAKASCGSTSYGGGPKTKPIAYRQSSLSWSWWESCFMCPWLQQVHRKWVPLKMQEPHTQKLDSQKSTAQTSKFIYLSPLISHWFNHNAYTS